MKIKVLGIDTEKEIWKDIKGYEGFYQVSNLGRIKSLDRIIKYKRNKKVLRKQIGKILKQANRKEYKFVALLKEAKRKQYSVHRLVAEAFIPNPDNLPEVNHLDFNPSNNCVTNLEWCTKSRNIKYSYDFGRRKSPKAMLGKKGRLHSRSKPILQYDLNGNFIKQWDCILEVERKLNIKNSNIVKCCKSTRNKAGGYIWKYLEV